MKLHALFSSLLAALGCWLMTSAGASDLPPTHFSVVGGGSHNYSFRAVERPFWATTLPASSAGKISARLIGLSESGLKGPEMLRVIRSGAVEIGMGVFAFVAGDDPLLEGIDLPGMAPDIATSRRVADAYEPVLAARLAERHGIKLLATMPYTAQVFFCREAVSTLEDLKGRKVRVRGRNMADMVAALGGSPVTLAFAEVVTALQTGVIDCAITGMGSGNAAKWYDVAGYIYDLPVDWSVGFYAMGLQRWKQLPEPVQRLLQAQAKVLEDALWQETARENRYALACNIGASDCQIHQRAKMQVTAPSDAERKVLREAVLRVSNDWGKRCGRACVEGWNATAGKAIGVNLNDP